MASSPLRLSVVIPAYNEAARLEPVVHGLAAYLAGQGALQPYEILVVDDGSLDNTGVIAQHLTGVVPGLRVLRLPRNQGKGAAVRAGLAAARGALRLYADADGATAWESLPALVAAVERPGHGLAIGSRIGGPVVTHPWRRTVGAAFRVILPRLVPTGCDDTQCGFKLLRAEAVQDILPELVLDRYAFDVEVIWRVRAHGWLVAEIPVAWVHQPGSQVRVVRDGLRMLGDLWWLRRRLVREHGGGRLDG